MLRFCDRAPLLKAKPYDLPYLSFHNLRKGYTVNESKQSCPVVLQTGFRIFFLGAVAYAIISMVFWLFFYTLGGNIFVTMPLTVWHGHEMIFGFTMAVVAGFLLTAVTNWTGLSTASGTVLLVLFIFWSMARILAFMPASVPLWPKAACDFIFMVFLICIVLRPIIKVKQWWQSAVISKLILVLLCGVVFFLALRNTDIGVEHKSLRFAIYMIVSLIFTISRRVMPFFIERGVGYAVTLRNSRILDITSLILLIGFSVFDIVWPQPVLIAALCIALVIVHSLRLAGWYTPGIWNKPLLWILFIGYLFLIVGFFLKVFVVLGHRPDDSALHAFTAGGIGIFTLGMMARVSWGHTGRNIADPPAQLPLIFVLLILGAVIRVFFPIFNESNHIFFIGISQALWIISYGLFLLVYFPILTLPRPDGKLG